MSAQPSAARRSRRTALYVVFACLSVPPIVALAEGAQYHVRNRSTAAIVSSGESREYLLHVPRSYDARTPVPLVISLHGAALWPAAQRTVSGWNEVADEHGFIVVYPAGREEPKWWGTLAAGPELDRDVRYIAELIDTLRAAYAIDTTRIYADGLSNGGGMAFVLSCTLASRIAAVGLVAPAQTLPRDWCPHPRPMPMIAFHGDADPIVPYRGGPMGGVSLVRPVFYPARDWVARWAERNHCAATPVESALAHDVVRTEYPGCDDAPVVLHTLSGGGHTWPGGDGMPEWYVGPTNRSIDATREMWAFFRRFRRGDARSSLEPLSLGYSSSLHRSFPRDATP